MLEPVKISCISILGGCARDDGMGEYSADDILVNSYYVVMTSQTQEPPLMDG